MECFTILQSGHLLCHFKATNGHAGVGFPINRKDYIMRVNSISRTIAEHDLSITKGYKLKIVQEEAINSFYNDVDETSGKLHDSDGKCQCANKEKNKPYGNGNGQMWARIKNKRDDTIIEWAISRNYKIKNTMFQKKSVKRWAWKSPNGVTNTAIDYILTNRPDIVTNVTLINQVNVGSNRRMAMMNIKLDVVVGKKR